MDAHSYLPLLYVLVLEPFVWKLDVSRDIPCGLGCGRFVSAYADDVTLTVLDVSEIEMVGSPTHKGIRSGGWNND